MQNVVMQKTLKSDLERDLAAATVYIYLSEAPSPLGFCLGEQFCKFWKYMLSNTKQHSNYADDFNCKSSYRYVYFVHFSDIQYFQSEFNQEKKISYWPSQDGALRACRYFILMWKYFATVYL